MNIEITNIVKDGCVLVKSDGMALPCRLCASDLSRARCYDTDQSCRSFQHLRISAIWLKQEDARKTVALWTLRQNIN